MVFKRSGFVYLLVIAAVLAASVFVLSISNLNQGFRRQVAHVAHRDICFDMAYSVYSGILARVYASPWSERFFASAPATANGEKILDATFDYLVEDSPGKSNQFDAYIRIHLNGKSRLYFWRVQYHDNMFDLSNSFSSIYFTDVSESIDPIGSDNRIVQEVERVLKNRELNREDSDKLSLVLKGSNNSKDIAEILEAPAPVFPENDFPEFNPIEPTSPEIIEVPPILPPPPQEMPQNPEVVSLTPQPDPTRDYGPAGGDLGGGTVDRGDGGGQDGGGD